MTARVFNVLFLCTGNSARSILAEAILNHAGATAFRGFSAGSHPRGALHPLALKLIAQLGFPTEGLRSKSWDEFAAPGAPNMDFIITVCDQAAGEVCPIWPGTPMTAHWGIADPAAAEGDDVAKMQAFRDTFRILERRIGMLVNLRPDVLAAKSVRSALEDIACHDFERATDRPR